MVLDPGGGGITPHVQDGARKPAAVLADAGYAAEKTEPPGIAEAAQSAFSMLSTPETGLEDALRTRAMMVGGTEGNTLADTCFTRPVTVIGSPVCGSGFMLAIEAATAPATARDQNPVLASRRENGSRGWLSRAPG